MGADISVCCRPNSPVKESPRIENDNLLLNLQTLLNEQSDESEEELIRQIYDLVTRGQTDELQQMIYDYDLDITTIYWKNNLTPLHIAAMKGHLETCQMLLLNGINPNVVDKLGRLPLHWAARNKHSAVYLFLKSITKDPSRPDLYGITPDSFLCNSQQDTTLTSGNCSPLSLSLSGQGPRPSADQIRSPTHSISSLTLHTISLSSSQSSSSDPPILIPSQTQTQSQCPLSPRVLDVSLEAQSNPSRSLTPPILSSSRFLETSQSSRSPFLVEEPSENGYDETVLEWEPHDENIRKDYDRVPMSVGISVGAMMSTGHTLPDELRNSYSQLSEMEDSLHPITIPESESHLHSDLVSPPHPPSCLIGRTKSKSRGFHALRRRLSILLFNSNDTDEHSHSSHSHSDWKPKNFLKSISFPSAHHSKIESESTQTPKPPSSYSYSSRVSESSEENSYSEELRSYESNETRIEDLDTPQSTQTISSISTQSEESKKTVKRSWMKFQLFEKKMKSLSLQSQKTETSTPFATITGSDNCNDREI